MIDESVQKSIDYFDCQVRLQKYVKIIASYTEQLKALEKEFTFYNKLIPLNKKERIFFAVRSSKFLQVVVGLTACLIGGGIAGLLFLPSWNEKALSFAFLLLVGVIIFITLGEHSELIVDEDLLDKLNSLLREKQRTKEDLEKSKQKLEKINQEMSNYDKKEQTEK